MTISCHDTTKMTSAGECGKPLKILVPVLPNICTGCKACATACPNGSITMVADAEGFLYPKRDASKCVQCRKCEKVCPVLVPFAESRPLSVYAVKAKDILSRFYSSSGGVFSALAQQCLSAGGIVFGAGFEKGTWRVVHKAATSNRELDELRGSKYVQSDVDLRSVRDAVASGRKVMFVGTPCQVAAVTRITGAPANLLTVDLVCHGVPSPLAWKRYLEQREDESGPIKRIQMRNKGIGWQVFSQCIEFANGSVYRASLYEDSFLRGFLRDIYLRHSCYECSCRGHRSGSDLTLGDYWGVSKSHPEFADDIGVSALMVNTKKGRLAFEATRHSLDVEASTCLCVSNGNPALLRSPAIPPQRSVFFNLLNTLPFDHAVDAALELRIKKNPKRIGIMTFHSQLNYGGVLQSAALRSAILELAKAGTEVFVIDRWMAPQNEPLTQGFSDKDAVSFKIGKGKLSATDIKARYHGRVVRTIEFIGRNLNLTKIHFLNWSELSPEDYKQLSLDLIVVGSDQVWHFGDWGNPDPYLLESCQSNVPAISYAASFGVKELGAWAPKFRRGLQRFSALSCREQEGVDFCSEIGYTAQHVIDPVGLVDYVKWKNNLLGVAKKGCKRNRLLCYCIEEDVECYLEALSAFAAKHGCVVTVFVNRLKKSWQTSGIDLPPLVEMDLAAGPLEFIQAFRGAKWVMTDSFHALMFSILEGVDVRVLRPVHGTSRGVMFARIEELARGFKDSILADSICDALASFDNSRSIIKFDRHLLVELRKKSRKFLLDVINGRGMSARYMKTAENPESELLKKLQSLEKIREGLWHRLQASEKANGELKGSLRSSERVKNELRTKIQAVEKSRGDLWDKLKGAEKVKGELWARLQSAERAKGELWTRLQESEKTRGEQWGKLQSAERAKRDLWTRLQTAEKAKRDLWTRLQATEKAKSALGAQLQAAEKAKSALGAQLQDLGKTTNECRNRLQASEKECQELKALAMKIVNAIK